MASKGLGGEDAEGKRMNSAALRSTESAGTALRTRRVVFNIPTAFRFNCCWSETSSENLNADEITMGYKVACLDWNEPRTPPLVTIWLLLRSGMKVGRVLQPTTAITREGVVHVQQMAIRFSAVSIDRTFFSPTRMNSSSTD